MPAARKRSDVTRAAAPGAARPGAKSAKKARAPHLAVVPPPEGAGTQVVLSDGATVHIQGGSAAEIRDRDGHLLVRYENGSAEIAAPTGDLRLAAPRGRVVLEAGTDIELAAPRDIGLSAGETARVEAAQAHIQAADTRVTGSDVTITAERFFTKVRALVHHAERMEVSAGRILEKAREAYRDVEELLQTRAGRARTVVEDAFHLQARRTSITSKDETSIDGKKVLLG